ncbi:nitrate transporter [Niveispirillum sp. SYP-B3756]|uniref:CmpA/NrtA family ABC transporter substrate-binding protein n=1 Tax=Niveispirillum sp. SYP-B3756 TaxID=2662178 RepID=UPI0012927897|nr:CmpA/NrtA family ABC transporter substrate-binding protein [Niveispirillum sp. SYP-B3756]MQP67377.1 nitrate transporter [Niveispirillum sp. SYP-B3756]
MPDIVKLGFAPLVDCAIPVVAAERGFAAAEGIDLVLERSNSWAALRDKLAFGLVDGAHLLAPLALAMHQGIAGIPAVPLVVPVTLGLGNNAITLSATLHARMVAVAPAIMAGPPAKRARALQLVIEADRARGQVPLSFATVFPFSCHHYELLSWLSDGGIDTRTDVNIGIVAPPRMVESLTSGWIDGYCAGEPWNALAVARGAGLVVATKADIRPGGVEKVLALRADQVTPHRDRTVALVRAMVRAANWCHDPANHGALARLLAEPCYVGQPAELIAATLVKAEAAKAEDCRPDLVQAQQLVADMMRAGQLAPDTMPDANMLAALWTPAYHDLAQGTFNAG